MKKISKFIAALFLVFSFIICEAIPVNASEITTGETNSMYDILEENIYIKDEKIVLNPQLDESIFSSDELAIIKEVINSYNELIASGYYIVSDNQLLLAETNITPFAQSGGVNSFQYYLIGYKVSINNTLCNKIVAGASFASIISQFIPNPAVAVIVTACLGASAAAIAFHNEGNGITMYMTTGGVVVWIRPQ